MNNSNNNHLNLLDLPDEILLIIFNKLNTVDVLYSLVDVNQRLDRLALNALDIRDLDMTIKPGFNHAFSKDDQDLSRICEKILPRIHHQIKKLTLEPNSIEHILFPINYPQLYSLSLVNFSHEIVFQYLTGDSIVYDILSKQITHLNIQIQEKTTTEFLINLSHIFALILSYCERLIDLNFCTNLDSNLLVGSYMLPLTGCVSSTLTKLKVNVRILNDCLDFLDGRLNCLSTLIICVEKIVYALPIRHSMEKLPKLKCFSLTSCNYTLYYDELIIPLLRRMINLEELKLHLLVKRRDSTYIDGIQLYNHILIYIPRVNKFTFSIKTHVVNKNIRIDLSSNEDIQRSFIGRGYGQVGSYSYVNAELMKTEGTCYIYSLPYEFEYFLGLDVSFPGGMFDKVRYLKMKDNRPFEHQLFKLVSQDFPVLEFLYIYNMQPQKDKQHSSTLITFPHLKFIHLQAAHADYAEQLLFEKNSHLPRLINLCIGYTSLAIITNNFTNDTTRFNFGKLEILNTPKPFVRPENFHQYFPSL